MLNVRELMTPEPKTASTSDNLAWVYDTLDAMHIRHLPVVDRGGELVGLVTHRELMRRVVGNLEHLPITRMKAELREMTVEVVMQTGVESVGPDQDITEAAELMMDNKFGCLPVVEGTRLVGILTETDFVRYVAANA